jgi:hypothetical protein
MHGHLERKMNIVLLQQHQGLFNEQPTLLKGQPARVPKEVS